MKKPKKTIRDPNQMTDVEITGERATLFQELINMATHHKKLDMQLANEAAHMDLREIQQFKSRITTHRLEMNRKIKEFEKFGGEWDDESGRRMVS